MMTTPRQRTVELFKRAGCAVVDEDGDERSPVKVRCGVASGGLAFLTVHGDAAKDAALSFLPATGLHFEGKRTDYLGYKVPDPALDFDLRDDSGLIAEVRSTLPVAVPFDIVDAQSEFRDFDPSADIAVAATTSDEIGRGTIRMQYACEFAPRYRSAPEDVVVALTRALMESHTTEEDAATFIAALDSAALVGRDHRKLVASVFRGDVTDGPVLERFVNPDHAAEMRAVFQMLAQGRNPLGELFAGRIRVLKRIHSI